MIKQNRLDSGVSLIELIIVMILVSILALFLAAPIQKGIESWYFVMDRADLMTQSHYGINRMMRELRQIKDYQSISVANTTSITFIDIKNNTITYSLSGGVIYRNANILLDGVTTFSLQYLDINGTIATAPKNIRKIKVTVRIQKGTNPIDMETTIKPRNL